MANTRINNHMTRNLPVRRPYNGTKSGLIVPMTAFKAQTVVIGPHKSAEIDFWDEVKNHPIYQNYLDRGLISTGNVDPNKDAPTPYTSFGDTMQPADSLNPESDEEEAAEVQMRIERGKNAEPEKAKRRGRHPKSEEPDPEKESLDEGEEA